MIFSYLYYLIYQYSQSAKARSDRFQVVLMYHKNFEYLYTLNRLRTYRSDLRIFSIEA